MGGLPMGAWAGMGWDGGAGNGCGWEHPVPMALLASAHDDQCALSRTDVTAWAAMAWVRHLHAVRHFPHTACLLVRECASLLQPLDHCYSMLLLVT